MVGDVEVGPEVGPLAAGMISTVKRAAWTAALISSSLRTT